MKTSRALTILVLAAMLLAMLFTTAACQSTPKDSDVGPASSTTSDIWGEATDSTTSDDQPGTTVSGDSTTPGNASTTTGKVSNTKTKTTRNNGFSDGGVKGNVVADTEEIPGLPPLSSKVKSKTVRYLTHVNASSTNKSVTKRYLPQYDMTVEYITVPYENKRTKLIQMISANDAPDVIGVDEAYLTLITNNLVQPVEKYLDFSDKVWDSVRSLQNARKVNGKIYEVISHGVPSRMVFFNAKLFKNAAEKDPLYYYQRGQWDWNKLVELAQKMTKDQNNDGITDQWGFGGEALQFMVMGAANESFIKIDAKGNVSNNLRSANLAKAMKLYTDLQTTYKVWPSSPSFEQIVSGKLAMGYFGYWNINTVSGAQKLWKSGDLKMVPSPSMPGKKNYNFPLYESSFIPVGAKNPYGAAAFLTYLKYQEAAGSDSNTPKDMQKVYAEACKNLMTSATNRDISAVASMEWGVCGDLRNGKSWSSIIEEYAPKLDASIAQLPKMK